MVLYGIVQPIAFLLLKITFKNGEDKKEKNL